jgi:hypothetical protein
MRPVDRNKRQKMHLSLDDDSFGVFVQLNVTGGRQKHGRDAGATRCTLPRQMKPKQEPGIESFRSITRSLQ